jgi:hypothetical protein
MPAPLAPFRQPRAWISNSYFATPCPNYSRTWPYRLIFLSLLTPPRISRACTRLSSSFFSCLLRLMQNSRTNSARMTATIPPRMMHNTAVPERPAACPACAKAVVLGRLAVVEVESAVVCVSKAVIALPCPVASALPRMELCSSKSKPRISPVLKCEGGVGGSRVSTARPGLEERLMARSMYSLLEKGTDTYRFSRVEGCDIPAITVLHTNP